MLSQEKWEQKRTDMWVELLPSLGDLPHDEIIVYRDLLDHKLHSVPIEEAREQLHRLPAGICIMSREGAKASHIHQG